MGIPEGEEVEQGFKNLFEEIMTENFPNPVKENNTQVQEVQRVPNNMNPNRPTHHNSNGEDKGQRILKAARERQLPTRELP